MSRFHCSKYIYINNIVIINLLSPHIPGITAPGLQENVLVFLFSPLVYLGSESGIHAAFGLHVGDGLGSLSIDVELQRPVRILPLGNLQAGDRLFHHRLSIHQ